MKNIVLFSAFVSALFLASSVSAQQYARPVAYNPNAQYTMQNQAPTTYSVVLHAGTPIELETLMPVDGKFLNVGQTIEFRVKYDVVVKRQVVIAAGSPARGIVTRLDKPKMMGKGGYMEIQPQYVNTVDNQMLPISASPLRLEGKKNGWAWAGVVVGVATGGVGAAATGFIKGKNARVESGMTVFASIASTREVYINN
ncbi:MAG TPA: hypothetical protein PLO67_20080 [Saprospiraceae bacterium]|nr:hypothetical protein [Saprospiraceae bacterium]HPI05827.1 hypothetical protein [Saprospiraceae bacterium]